MSEFQAVHDHNADGVRDALRALLGLRIDGGCDTCPAVTHLSEDSAGQFRGNVGHTPDCPTWQRIKPAADDDGRWWMARDRRANVK